MHPSGVLAVPRKLEGFPAFSILIMTPLGASYFNVVYFIMEMLNISEKRLEKKFNSCILV